MILELNHVGAFASDAEKSIKFYTENLGAKVVSEALIPVTNTRCIYLQISNGLIELLCRGDGSTPKYGFDHVAFLVDNLDQTYEELVAAGYKFSVAPKIAGSGRGRLAFLSDPNGVRIELIQRDESFRIPKITEGKVRSFDHISLVANELEAAKEFYTKHMGLEHLKTMRIDLRDLDMVYIMKGDDVIEFLHKSIPQTGVNLIGHIALRVDNVDEMTEFLKSKGVEFEPGSPKAAGTGIGRVSVFRDPDGAKIELVDRKDLREI